MPSHFAFSRQSLLHVPEVHVPLHVVESLQSKLHSAPVQMRLQLAVSSHCALHRPPVQTIEHLLHLSQFIAHVSPVAQTKSHVLPSVQLQTVPHCFRVEPLSTAPDDEAAPSLGVPLDPPLLLAVLPLDDVDDGGAPLPIVQSYEQAARPTKTRTEMTAVRRTPRS